MTYNEELEAMLDDFERMLPQFEISQTVSTEWCKEWAALMWEGGLKEGREWFNKRTETNNPKVLTT